jgi:pimeloyl-ACP methyl ester carboxylesterase
VPPAGGTGPSPDIAALIGYTGPAMADPTLAKRLGGLDLPVHVVWGESDGIVTPDYGRAFAAAIPLSKFTLLPRTGHLPQVETPEELLGALLDLGGAA